MWRQLTYKKALLVIWKILRLFSNALIVDGRYSLVNTDNLKQPLQMQLDQKPKTFSEFCFAFLKLTSNFEHFRKKGTLIANVSPKLRTPKNVTRTMSKKSRFGGSLEKQHRKRYLKFERQHLYHIYWSMWRKLTYKKSLLVICNILRLFSNTSSADGRYSLLNTDDLTQPIQMRVSQRQRTFSRFFSAFLKSSLNFEHFEKKDDPHSWCISEITDSKKRG